MKQTKLCPYCDPIPNSSTHSLERVEKLWQLPTNSSTRIRKRTLLTKISPRFFNGLTSIGLGLGVSKTVSVPTNTSDGRVQLLAKAAQKKNIKIKRIMAFGRPSTLFVASKNNQSIRFELLPTWPIGWRMPINIDDKAIFKTLLTQNNLRVPAGRVFSNQPNAITYVHKEIKYPVVVKPASGSLSMHVTADIKNKAELVQAIKVAKIVSRNVVVEKYIEGNVYRLLCIRGQLAAAGLRKPPEVVGDGKSTIKQLIQLKNRKRKSAGLKLIPVTYGLHQNIADQNLQITSVVPKGKSVILFNKVILAAGAQVEDVTSVVHPHFKSLAEKAAQVVDLPVVGFDIIAQDISQPARGQDYGFIEANSMPFFDMHKNAYTIAQQIWDIAYNKKEPKP